MRGDARVRAWAASTSIALALGACNAITGLDADYQLETDGGSSVVDATRDSTAADGTLPPTDGGADADPGGPFSCNGQPTTTIFCTTFEPPADIGKDWDRTQTAGGAPSIAPGAGRNGTYGLRTSTSSTGTAANVVWKTVTQGIPPGRTLRLSYWFRVTAFTTDYAATGAFQFAAREHGLAIYRTNVAGCPSGLCLDENDQQSRGHAWSGVALVKDVWHNGEVTLTRTGNAYGGTVKVDGVSVDDRATNAMPDNSNPGKVEYGVGAFYTGSAGTSDVIIDDVLVQLL